MNQLPSDSALDALLKSQAHSPLPDDGFTARVMNILPPVSRPASGLASPETRSTLLVASASLLGAFIAITNLKDGDVNAMRIFSVQPLMAFIDQFGSSQSVWIGLSMLAVTLATLYFLDTQRTEE